MFTCKIKKLIGQFKFFGQMKLSGKKFFGESFGENFGLKTLMIWGW